MNKKDEFLSFVKNNTSFAKYVESGQMTWQKFYELYDIYGEDSKVWDDYKNERNDSENSSFKINDIIKNVNIDAIKEHISTAQKALDFVQELTSKTPTNSKSIVTPRPINKFFED